MNSRTHSLIVKVLAVHGVLAMVGSFMLLSLGKQVPIELMMIAGMIVSGLTGHMAPHPKEHNDDALHQTVAPKPGPSTEDD